MTAELELPGANSGSISVIIPARNAAATVARTVRSLAPDAGLISEILLVDDGSTDGTADVARAVAAGFGMLLRVVFARAGSPGGARNAGLAECAGTYIYFIDSDDEALPGGLALLLHALQTHPQAGLAIGANIRRTHGRVDKLKIPYGYASDCKANVAACLRNGIWPIAMGSALVRRTAIGEVRFPAKAGLDEDTVFWAAILSAALPVTIADAVLLYHHDEERMNRRFLEAPERAFAEVAAALDMLAGMGVDPSLVSWRKAWVARRLARQLIYDRRFHEAEPFLRRALLDRGFARSLKAMGYRLRVRAGKLWPQNPAEAPGKSGRAVQAPANILFITNDPVWPPVSGYDLRNWSIVRSLARHGAVTIASVARLASDCDVPLGIRQVTLAGEASTGKAKALSHWRAKIEARLTRETGAELARILRELNPGLTLVAGIPLCRLLDMAKAGTGKLVLDMHNVESELQRQQSKSVPVPRRFRAYFEAVRTARLEAGAAALCDAFLACSRHDRDRIVRRFRARLPVQIVPNIAPPMTAGRERRTQARQPSILFVGHLGYWPNIAAARRLAQNILPIVRKSHPDARLVLAGRSPKPEVRALKSLPGVDLVENPDDLTGFYDAAAVTVMPISQGGGTRIKILEAMSRKVPVVATQLAAEGLDFAAGRDFLLAETDAELAAAACLVIDNPDIAESLSARAAVTVEARFSTAALDDAIDDLIQTLFGNTDSPNVALSAHQEKLT